MSEAGGRKGGRAFHPGQVPIDAYGNGGFRFADMSHRGSLLCLPSGMHGWDAAANADKLDEAAFAKVVAEVDAIEVLLIGTGDVQVFLDPELRAALEARGLAPEPMATGAAARTYNVLLAEDRAVAAALLATQ